MDILLFRYNTINILYRMQYVIRDKWLAYKGAIVLLFMAIMFSLHAVPYFQSMSYGWVMVCSVFLLIILCDNGAQFPQLVHQVEWNAMVFVTALFIMMECMYRLGFVQFIGNVFNEHVIANLVDAHDSPNIALSLVIVVIIWVCMRCIVFSRLASQLQMNLVSERCSVRSRL